jgi:hypothetical protein
VVDRGVTEVDAAEDVDLGVADRLSGADRDAGLRRLMADHVRPEAADDFVQALAIADVELRELRRGGDVRPLARAEIVDDEHLMAALDRRVRDVTTDEARSTRD